MEEERIDYRSLTEAIIGGAIEVHRHLGPGLLESTYRSCLAYELTQRGFAVEVEKEFPVAYKGVLIDCGYRLAMRVNGVVLLELKSVERLHPVHEAQLISYLKLTGCEVGLLINFHVRLLRDGIKRIINEFPE